MASIRRVHPSSIANLFVRSILADIGELHGGFTRDHWQATLTAFSHRCAYTGRALSEAETDRDHAVPLNRTSGGLHMFGNLLPACRQANNEKGSLPFDVFLRSAPGRFASLNGLTPVQREANIERIEKFMETAGYQQAVAQRPELLAYYEKKYSLLQELCAATRLETDALMQRMTPAVVRPLLDEAEALPLEDDVQDEEGDLTDRLPSAYRLIVSAPANKRIGKLAQALFRQLFADGHIAPYLSALTSREYSIRRLGLYVPVLAAQREQVSGQYRYYADPLIFEGTQYFLGTEWNNSRRAVLLDWLTDEVFKVAAEPMDVSVPVGPPETLPLALTPATGSSAELRDEVRAIWERVGGESRGARKISASAIGIGEALQQIFQLLDANAAGFAALNKVLEDGHALRMGNELTMLRPYTSVSSIDQQRKDVNGYNRYYGAPLNEHKLLLSSQWSYDRHYAEWTRIFQAAGF